MQQGAVAAGQVTLAHMRALTRLLQLPGAGSRRGWGCFGRWFAFVTGRRRLASPSHPNTNIPPIRKEYRRATSIKQIHLNCSMRDRRKMIQHRKISLPQHSTHGMALEWRICAIINLLKSFPPVDRFISEFVGSVSAQKLPDINCPTDLQLPQTLLDPMQLKFSHAEPMRHYLTAIYKVYNSFPWYVLVKLKNL